MLFGIFLALLSGVAIRKPERHVRKASHCGGKQQWMEITCDDHSMSIVLLLAVLFATHVVIS